MIINIPLDCIHPNPWQTRQGDPDPAYIKELALDLNPANNAWWNLAALCQRCHLKIQAKVIMERYYMFEHSAWFRPYVAGYYAHLHGLPDDREYVLSHLDELLEYGRP